MDQTERDRLSAFFRADSHEQEDLLLLLEHASPSKRAEIREYLAGWHDCMGHFLELRQRPEVEEFLRKLEAEDSG